MPLYGIKMIEFKGLKKTRFKANFDYGGKVRISMRIGFWFWWLLLIGLVLLYMLFYSITWSENIFGKIVQLIFISITPLICWWAIWHSLNRFIILSPEYVSVRKVNIVLPKTETIFVKDINEIEIVVRSREEKGKEKEIMYDIIARTSAKKKINILSLSDKKDLMTMESFNKLVNEIIELLSLECVISRSDKVNK